jgi:hypothetical protein
MGPENRFKPCFEPGFAAKTEGRISLTKGLMKILQGWAKNIHGRKTLHQMSVKNVCGYLLYIRHGHQCRFLWISPAGAYKKPVIVVLRMTCGNGTEERFLASASQSILSSPTNNILIICHGPSENSYLRTWFEQHSIAVGLIFKIRKHTQFCAKRLIVNKNKSVTLFGENIFSSAVLSAGGSNM